MPTFWNAVMPADRRHLDDVPAALGAQERQRRLGNPQRAEHVGLDLVARFGFREFLDEAELAVAGVVDDDVEAPEVVVRRGDGGEIRVAIGHVELDGQQRVGVLLGQVVQRGDVARGGRDLVAAFQRGDRPLASEAARCPGDEPNFFTHVRL